MSSLTKCPYCGASVSVQETFCTNCFWDLRKEGGGEPKRTMVTQAQSPPSEPPPSPTEPTPGADEFGVMPNPAEPRRPVASPAPAARLTPPPAPPREAPAPVRSAGASPVPANAPASKAAPSPAASGGEPDSALPYRPRLRPPIAILRILDDDGQDAELFRIRASEVIIGRSEGDVVIPHERLMSSRHAKLVRRFVDGAHRWFLVDLDSTNGTFVKISSCRLQHRSELMFGSFRYQFDASSVEGQADGEAETQTANAPQRTMGWARVTQDDLAPSFPKLTRIAPGGEVTDFQLPGTDARIGSGQTGVDVSMADDPLLSSAHARIYQDRQRRWFIEDLGSRNGLWIAIREQELDKSAMFQLGEQRFNIRFSQ